MKKIRVCEAMEGNIFGENITKKAIRLGYDPEKMTKKDCEEIAKIIHTEKSNGEYRSFKWEWTQDVWVENDGHAIVHGSYTAGGNKND